MNDHWEVWRQTVVTRGLSAALLTASASLLILDKMNPHEVEKLFQSAESEGEDLCEFRLRRGSSKS